MKNTLQPESEEHFTASLYSLKLVKVKDTLQLESEGHFTHFLSHAKAILITPQGLLKIKSIELLYTAYKVNCLIFLLCILIHTNRIVKTDYLRSFQGHTNLSHNGWSHQPQPLWSH